MSAGVVLLVFGILALLDTPLAAALGLAAAVSVIADARPVADSAVFTFSLAEFLDSPALISIPLFALAGEMAAASGIAERLVRVAATALGRRDPGLAAILAATLFATVSGIGPAVASGLSVACIPAMRRRGVATSTAVGLAATLGGLGIVIPASMPLTLFAAMAGINTNTMFAASFLPGLLAALLLAITWLWMRMARGGKEEGGITAHEKPRLAAAVRDAAWALALPVLLLGSLFSGVLRAPEAAAFAAAYAAVVGRFVHKTLDARRCWAAMQQAALLASAALAVAAAAGLFFATPALAVFPARFADALAAACGSGVGALLVCNLIVLAAGFVLDSASLVILSAPLFLPIVGRLGMSPYQLGAMMVVAIAISLATPPHGLALSAAARAAGVSERRSFQSALPFLAAFLVVLVLATVFPALSLWFPSLCGW